MAEQRLTNLSYLEEMGMGDDDLLIEMLEMFLNNTPDTIAQLYQYCEEDNWEKLSATAHKLKPNLTYVGLGQVREIIEEIEDSTQKNPDPDVLRNQITEVDEICQKAYKELEQQLSDLKK